MADPNDRITLKPYAKLNMKVHHAETMPPFLTSQQPATTSKPSPDDPNMKNATVFQGMKQTSEKDSTCKGRCEELTQFLKQGPYSDIQHGVYSDFKLKCTTTIFHLHRVIVCPQSPYFTNILRSPGTFFYNRETSQIDFPTSDPRLFSKLFQLMYLHHLDPDPKAPPLTILENIKLCEIAQTFGGEQTQKLAFNLVKSRISNVCNGFQTDDPALLTNWNTFVEIVGYFGNTQALMVKHQRLVGYVTHCAAVNWRFVRAGEGEQERFLKKASKFMVRLLAVMGRFEEVDGVGEVEGKGGKRTADEAFGSEDCWGGMA